MYVHAYALKYTGVLGTGIKLRTTFLGPHVCPCHFIIFFLQSYAKVTVTLIYKKQSLLKDFSYTYFWHTEVLLLESKSLIFLGVRRERRLLQFFKMEKEVKEASLVLLPLSLKYKPHKYSWNLLVLTCKYFNV